MRWFRTVGGGLFATVWVLFVIMSVEIFITTSIGSPGRRAPHCPHAH